MTVAELVALLGRSMLFSGLEPDDLRRLAGIARVTTLAAERRCGGADRHETCLHSARALL